MEAIAWLTLESDRSDLLLAMAFHLDQWSDWPHGSDMATGAAAAGDSQDLRSDARERLELDEYLARASRAAMRRVGTEPPSGAQRMPQPASGAGMGGPIQAPRVPFKPPPRLKPEGKPPFMAQHGLLPKYGSAP